MALKNCYNYWQQAIILLITISVFCFWYFAFPYVIVIRESLLLFLWNSGYFMERIAIPGGLAQYIGEGLVQFFRNPLNGALIYALLFVTEQWLTNQLLKQAFPTWKKAIRFALSLIPPIILWRIAMIPEVPLTPTIAIILVMALMFGLTFLPKKIRAISTCVLLPIVYWFTGPAAILLVFCAVRWMPLTAILFAGSLIGSSWIAPYPLQKIAMGIDYYWGKERNIGTYEQMECDMLVRMNQWSDIISKFQYSNSATVTSAVRLANFETGQIGRQELFASMVVPKELQSGTPTIFSSNGLHLSVNFESLTAAYMVSDIAIQMYLPTISQRAAFEAMEFTPNYNKSGRALQRLVQTNMITGNYKTALKYLSILEETTFYREWAHEMRHMAEHPQLVKKNPFFKQAQEAYANAEDMFFI